MGYKRMDDRAKAERELLKMRYVRPYSPEESKAIGKYKDGTFGVSNLAFALYSNGRNACGKRTPENEICQAIFSRRKQGDREVQGRNFRSQQSCLRAVFKRAQRKRKKLGAPFWVDVRGWIHAFFNRIFQEGARLRGRARICADCSSKGKACHPKDR